MTIPARPIQVRPVLDPKPWGGRRLEACGISLADHDRVGEALLTAPEAIVVAGPLAGLSLAELARDAPESWVGRRGLAATGGRGIFPLLIKLIDASATLSIQVHPGDAAAAVADLGTGKTEAWHLLDADSDSVLYLGLLPEVCADEFTRACLCRDGSAALFLRQLPATPGLTVVVPAGTPHAIGAGCLVYEIQQPSNVTFRLDDWGRLDTSGQSRELHHDAGFAALDPRSRPAPIPAVMLSTAPRRELLAATRYFALERISLEPSGPAALPAIDTPQVLTCLTGEASPASGDWRGTIHAGETIVLPAGINSTLGASQPAVVLRGWVPDLEREVIRPASDSGVPRDVIELLGVNIGGA